MDSNDLEYVGFWARVGAALIDSVVLLVIITPALVAVYGWQYFTAEGLVQGPADVLISWAFPALACIWLWHKLRATPGKMLIGAEVVDADTGQAMTLGQSVIRYLGYFVSTIPLGLGLLWVALDPRKQGWHDKIANTVVVRKKGGRTQSVVFANRMQKK